MQGEEKIQRQVANLERRYRAASREGTGEVLSVLNQVVWLVERLRLAKEQPHGKQPDPLLSDSAASGEGLLALMWEQERESLQAYYGSSR